jgi:hypothetical protein
VEQKIDGLVATLVNGESAKPTEEPDNTQSKSSLASRSAAVQAAMCSIRPHAPGGWLPNPPSYEPRESQPDEDADISHRYMENLRMIHSFGDDDVDLSRPPGSLFNTGGRKEPVIEDEVVEQLLSNGEADNLLNAYREMSVAHPFVPIASHVKAKELSDVKPILFLAILTVASWNDHSLQRRLDRKYRQELANRTIIRPRRTLSLAQSIVVYLGWYVEPGLLICAADLEGTIFSSAIKHSRSFRLSNLQSV